MKATYGSVASLLRAEQCNKARIEFLKLKSIDKTADVVSTDFSRVALGTVTSLKALGVTLLTKIVKHNSF